MSFKYSEKGPTADLMIDAWGKSMEEAFASAASAMFNAMTPIEKISEKEVTEFTVEGNDVESLLFNFLDELLYHHEVSLLVYSRFELDIDIEKFVLTAECWGETFDLERHAQGISIKAVTFHKMKITKEDCNWKIRVVLDT
jgi:SHS2 domain-containing protein